MTTAEWAAGDDHGLVWEHGVALLAGSVPVEAAVQLWHDFRNGGDLSGFLQALTRDTGANVFALPDFAVALRTDGGGWQVAARGALQVINGEGDPISGQGISTWVERVVPASATMAVNRADVPPSAPFRPLSAGVVQAAWIGSGAARPETQASPPRPEPVAVQPPAPLPPVEPQREPDPEPQATPMTDVEPEPGVPAVADLDAEPEPMAAVADVDSEPDAPAEAESEPMAADPLATLQEEDVPFISSVPAQPEPDVQPAVPGRFARQFDATELHAIEDAAVRPDAEDAAPQRAEFGADEEGDHDGHTVMADGDPFAGPAQSAPPASDPTDGGARVLGVLCDRGHVNPPDRGQCADCGLPLTAPPQQVSRPSLGRLVLPNGERVELVEPLILGRNPRADRVQEGQLPRLIPLAQNHVSGTHLAIRLEQWSVLAVDLNSTNGTYLRRHGQAAVRLGERPEPLIEGDVLDLGHGVQLRLEQKR